MTSASDILGIENLTVQFGGLIAVDGVSFAMRRGEVLGLIGPNGAGKTSLFNAISGMVQAYSGRILVDGIEIGRSSPEDILKLGVTRTFQNIRLFRGLTVLENVLAGRHTQTHQSVLDAILRTPRFRRSEHEAQERAERCLAFAGMKSPSHALAGSLPYGEQRRLEIARALATYPKLLLLDEPVAGMNPQESRELAELIRHIRRASVSVLLVEHDMNVVMSVCDRLIVLDRGRVIATGTPAEIQRNPAVIAAYLGTQPQEVAD